MSIEVRATDTMMERADKLWRLIGMANDRFGFIPQLAAYLEVYRDLDERKMRDAAIRKEIRVQSGGMEGTTTHNADGTTIS